MSDLEIVKRELAAKSLKQFIVQGWENVEPTAPFVDNWHIGAICEHLEAMKSGQIPRLIINIPPGHMKSLTCSVFWLPWWWIEEPWIRSMSASYSGELSGRDSRKAHSLLISAWYRQRWGDRFHLGKQSESRIENNKGGLRIATSTGGMGTGERAHVVINDDLLRANDAHSEAERKRAIEHLRAMSTRGIIGYPFRQLLIMQRVHEQDPTGWILAQDLGFEQLILPAQYEKKRACVTSIGWKDPRTTEGEILWPHAFPLKSLEYQRLILGSYGYAGQFQQRPAPDEGGIFKRAWWKFYNPEALPVFTKIIQSWDTAFKKDKENDYSVCTTWGVTENAYYLLHVWRQKVEFPELKRQVIALNDRWNPNSIIIEDKASGQSLIQELQRETLLPVYAVRVDGDKIARAYAVTPMIEAGRVWLPERADWLADYLDELSVFSNGTFDDQVDSTTQGLDYLLHQPDSGLLSYYMEESESKAAAIKKEHDDGHR